MLSTGEVDALCCDENESTLLHKAAAYGHLPVLQLLGKEVPASYLQLADNFFLTPAMLAIQVCLSVCLSVSVCQLRSALYRVITWTV